MVAPLALKLFHQRWYMLSHTGNHFATYSLDRMQEMKLTDETFEVPEDFSPDIRPTYDFINELCSYHKGLEVLEPQDFREKIRDYLVETLSRY